MRGPRGPMSTSVSPSSPICTSSRTSSPICCAPSPTTSSTATSPPTPRSPRNTRPSAAIATPGTWAKRFSTSRSRTRCGRLAGLSVPPRRRFGGAQLLRPAPARPHLEHDRAGAQLLGEPLRDALGRRLREGGKGRHSPRPRAERCPPRFDHLAHVVQHPDQPAAVPRHGAPDRERELALGVPAVAREHALGPARRLCGAPHGGGIRVRNADAGRAGCSGAAARSGGGAGPAAREADAASGVAGGGARGARAHAGDGGTALRLAHAGARLLAPVRVAATVAGSRGQPLGGEFLLEHLLHQLRVGLAARHLHYLADEERL